jgi:hypothetical protein
MYIDNQNSDPGTPLEVEGLVLEGLGLRVEGLVLRALLWRLRV